MTNLDKSIDKNQKIGYTVDSYKLIEGYKMYTVKRFTKGQIISQTKISNGTIGNRAKKTVFVVVDENGKVAISTNPVTGKISQEVYPRKATAQQVANFYNKNTL